MKCNLDYQEWLIRGIKLATVVLSLMASLVIFRLCRKHLAHYTNPHFQKKIIVIVLIIPFYALNSLFGVLFVHLSYVSEILAIIRGLYEAVLVISFFQLIVAFLCWREEVSTPTCQHMPYCFRMESRSSACTKLWWAKESSNGRFQPAGSSTTFRSRSKSN